MIKINILILNMVLSYIFMFILNIKGLFDKEQSKSNKFLKNRIRRTNTKGVLFDQLKGATSNRLE